jgi:hypothetical protein
MLPESLKEKLKGYNKVRLALVSKESPWPILFEYKRMSQAGRKAALTRKRRNAGIKAAETRRQNTVT